MTTCYTPCINCSYEEVAKTECDTITSNAYEADVCIDDPINFFKRFHSHYPQCLLWGDTMANPLYYREYTNVPPFMVASRWNMVSFLNAGFRVIDVKPRHINVCPSVTSSERKNLFVTVGVSRFFDRKNISLISELGIRKYTFIVSRPNPGLGIRNGKLTKVDVVNPDMLAFTVTKRDLMEQYANSRFYLAFSLSEGFGLPPIEAMYYGVIPIFVNGHGFKENLVGIEVSVRDEYTLDVGDYYFKIWEPDIREIKNVVSEILKGNMKEIEDDLREKVKERAMNFMKK